MTTLPTALVQAHIPLPVIDVVTVLQTKGYQAYLVGGCVRDLLRGRIPADFDVTTDALPDQVQKAFRKVIPTGIQHGTVTVISKGLHVEVTTFRSETDYLDGRRPTAVKFETKVEDDLARRDFTINAMAFDPIAKVLVDHFRGQEDLENKIVRCVGDAHARFSEDGLRTLRAVRFATVLNFQLEAQTQNAISATIPVFQKVAMERVQVEFQKVLLSEHVVRGLNLLHSTQLLQSFLPELNSVDHFEAVGRIDSNVELRLATLFYLSSTTANIALERLKFPRHVIQGVSHWLAHRALPVPSSSDADLRRYISRVGSDSVLPICALAQAQQLDTAQICSRMTAILGQKPPLQIANLAVSGTALMKRFSVSPGPHIGNALRFLLDKVLEDPSLNTVEKLEAILIDSNFPEFSTK